jgi:hypothetical protein
MDSLVQSDIVATSGAYTYGFARFSADLPRTLVCTPPPPPPCAMYLRDVRDTHRGRLHTGGVSLLAYAPGRLLASRAQLAPSRNRADPTRRRGDVRQDRARGMVRLYLRGLPVPITYRCCICTQDEWRGHEVRARSAHACTSQVGPLTTLAMTQRLMTLPVNQLKKDPLAAPRAPVRESHTASGNGRGTARVVRSIH